MSAIRNIDLKPTSNLLKRILSSPIYYITFTVLLVILIIALIVTLVLVLKDSSKNSDIIDYSKALIVTRDDYDIFEIDLKSEKPPSLLLRTSQVVRTFDFYNDTIYYSEADSLKLNSSSSKYKNLRQQREWQPVAVALDILTRNVYVLDARGSKLDVYNPYNRSFGIAVADLKDPVDIALDPQRGVMFIVQESDSILKGNMDGTMLEKLITSDSVNVLALDHQTPRLYWAEDEKIVSSDYMGNDRRIVYHIPQETGIKSIGVSGNRLFWIQPLDNANPRNLWTCTTIDGICHEENLLQMPFDYAKQLKVHTEQESISSDNPCAELNGGCQHLCLLTAGNSERYSCACFVGYKLGQNSKSCKPAREFLLYVRRNLIRGRILDADRQTFTDTIVPISLDSKVVLFNKSTIDFDYNYHTNTLAYSDDASIYMTNLKKDEYRRLTTPHKCLKDVSFDWVTNDLYYVKDHCNTKEEMSIVLLKPSEEPYTMILSNFSSVHGNLRSLVVNPNTGTYFFTILFRNRVSIYRGHESKWSMFSKNSWSVSKTSLALDALEDRLYWLSADLKFLHSVKLESREDEPTSVDISAIVKPRAITLYERHVYISNLTSIWRLDKLTGRRLIKLTPAINDNEVISGVKIFAKAVQRKNASNPCGIQNGGCQQFCLRVPISIINGNSVEVTNRIQKKCFCDDSSRIRHGRCEKL